MRSTFHVTVDLSITVVGPGSKCKKQVAPPTLKKDSMNKMSNVGRRSGGQVFSCLAFYSSISSSNPAESQQFYFFIFYTPIYNLRSKEYLQSKLKAQTDSTFWSADSAVDYINAEIRNFSISLYQCNHALRNRH